MRPLYTLAALPLLLLLLPPARLVPISIDHPSPHSIPSSSSHLLLDHQYTPDHSRNANLSYRQHISDKIINDRTIWRNGESNLQGYSVFQLDQSFQFSFEIFNPSFNVLENLVLHNTTPQNTQCQPQGAANDVPWQLASSPPLQISSPWVT